MQPSGRDLAGGGEAGERVDDVVGVDAEAVPGGASEVELVGDVAEVDQASRVAADVAGELLLIMRVWKLSVNPLMPGG